MSAAREELAEIKVDLLTVAAAIDEELAGRGSAGGLDVSSDLLVYDANRLVLLEAERSSHAGDWRDVRLRSGSAIRVDLPTLP